MFSSVVIWFALYLAICIYFGRAFVHDWQSLECRDRAHRILRLLVFALVVGAWFNMVAYFGVGAGLGGFAGKVELPQYFLELKGKLREVSREVWLYSLIHGYVTWLLLGVSALAIAWFAWRGTWQVVPRSAVIRVNADGRYEIDGKCVTLEQAIEFAEMTRLRGRHFFVLPSYPPDRTPPEATVLLRELSKREILRDTT